MTLLTLEHNDKILRVNFNDVPDIYKISTVSLKQVAAVTLERDDQGNDADNVMVTFENGFDQAFISSIVESIYNIDTDTTYPINTVSVSNVGFGGATTPQRALFNYLETLIK